MKHARFLIYTFAAALLTIPTLGLAQSDMTCHITPFTAPASSGLAVLSTAVSVNRYGNAIGDDSNGRPYIRYSNGEVKPLPIFSNGGGATVTKRNAAGVTVGFFGGGSFINSGGKTTVLNVGGQLTGINQYGSLVGDAGGGSAFLVKKGQLTLLTPPTAFARETQATAISDTGVIVGTYALQNSAPDPDQTTHGFLLINGQWQDFADPNRLDTYPTDINASGMIVGLLDDSSDDYTFIYKGGKFYQPVFVYPDGSKQSAYVEVVGVNGYGEISRIIKTANGWEPYVGTCSL